MDPVSFEARGDVAVVTMDDGKVNALSPAMIRGLDAALDRAEAEAKAVLILGREGKLCAGFDLKVMGQGADAATQLFVDGGDLMIRMFAHPQPLVIGCPGHAIAGGALLLAVADLRVGARGDFKIGLNEVAIGLELPLFAHRIARARLDRRHLDRATLLATLYDPDSAVEAGWLDQVVEAAALREAALGEATRLAALDLDAFARSKQSMRGPLVEELRRRSAPNLRAIIGRRLAGG